MLRRWTLIMGLPLVTLFMTSCLSLSRNNNEDVVADETVVADAPANGEGDAFAEFQDPDPDAAPGSQPTTEAPVAPTPPAAEVASNQNAATNDVDFGDLNLEAQAPEPDAANNQAAEPMPNSGQDTAQAPPAQADEFDFNLDEPLPGANDPEPAEPLVMSDTSPALNVPAPKGTGAGSSQGSPVNSNGVPFEGANEVKSVQFKTHDNGGTLIIQADKPLLFTTRRNEKTNQLIVEISNAFLPDKFKRPLNMRDMIGSIGSVDAYQDVGSSTARFVIQLRTGANNPFVITEGSTLLVVADVPSQVTAALKTATEVSTTPGGQSTLTEPGGDSILTSRTLQEFLAGNTKFYGKRISLETNSMPVREALRFIAEEGGVNMIVADNIQGNVSLKLRDVPWDQAFIVIMKSKDLGYVRQGNVLRVATLGDLRKEEEDTISLTAARLRIEPLVVKVYPINYARVDELSGRVRDFLTDRGKVAGDVRTNSIVVTDVTQNLERISQLIQSLDTQPPQVLIEGRIIEATDEFTRQIGVNWSSSGGEPYLLGRSNQGLIGVRPSLNITTGRTLPSTLNLQVGVFDILGDINAVLTMNEIEQKLRVLSSPRVVTLSNEKAVINQSQQIPISVVQPINGVLVNNVQFRPLELKLEVTPQITSNASVIMNINVKRDIPGAAFGDQISIESREASTKVMVKNGQTSIIGGVYQNDTTYQAEGIPILKDIPLLGALFRNTRDVSRRTELMIFLTPRIVAAGYSAPEEPVKATLSNSNSEVGGLTNAN
ncbi:MAG: type IV pilus secretin PilQ [Bdellovibrionales bacterium]